MLEASNIEPIMGARKAYFEGPEHASNSVKEIIPHGFMKQTSGSGFYEKPENELRAMVRDHFHTESIFTSDFSSWTGSLHLALCYAESIDEEHDPHVAIMDTHGLDEMSSSGMFRTCIGYKAVSYKTLTSAGLAQILPELMENDLTDWGMSLRDQMFNGPSILFPMDNIEQSDEMKQVRAIAYLYGHLYGHLYVPLATSSICPRPRSWLRSRAEGKAALDKIANLFANTKPLY
ncbi:hypothetical protein J4E91_006811 [Alternaria rosae]|nr:hypothetical protein J4E91_006811 [Alternaria rosae]